METVAADPARPTAPGATSSRRRVVAVVKAAVCLVVLAFVGWALVQQFRRVAWDEVRFHPGLAALAVVVMLGVNGSQLVMFRTLLGAYGWRLPWRVTLGAAWVPPLGKYVPGKVASVAGAVYLLRRHGVPGAVAVSVALMLDGLAVIAGLVLSTPLLLWEPVRRQMPTAWLWSAALAAAGVVALHPRVFVGLLNALLRRLGRAPVAGVPRVGQYVLPVAAAFGQWAFAGLGLWLMTRAVAPDVSAAQIPLFIATAAMAMTVSYLALFAPGGLGVREGLYLLALGPVVGPKAAIVVVAMRVVQTLTELALAGVGLAALRAAGDEPIRPAPARVTPTETN
jgi:uncharacterized membrane protein YbhN (UPF0104 family)